MFEWSFSKERNAYVVQDIEQGYPNDDQHRVAGDSTGDAEEQADCHGGHEDAQDDEVLVLAIFPRFGIVHDVPLKWVIDRIQYTASDQENCAKRGSQCADAGIIGEIKQEQTC